jgi:hypothetical protein
MAGMRPWIGATSSFGAVVKVTEEGYLRRFKEMLLASLHCSNRRQPSESGASGLALIQCPDCRAAYQEPARAPTGTSHVFVNGVFAVRDGQ